ncbi:6-phosphogluconolactonase [Hyphomonas pacifica]|uniref:6-phosphogluconolactonase n=1 Tax=Hyphomonas pacifica TaxID=1280941 RepID=UPI001313FC7C|nr:6-phosphogluconolactonase [Hyphomonas pacifica]
MTAMRHEFLSFETRQDASRYATEFIARALEKALEDEPVASLMVSGGSTPGGVFDNLTEVDLAWERVIVGLVDERWVGPESDASNERLVRKRLLTGKSGAAGFLPMKTEAQTAGQAVQKRQQAYLPHCSPVDVILLGMGEDGHTASWFPNSSGLEAAMSCETDQAVAVIDATGCPVAGDNTDRMTLTGAAVGKAKAAVLLIFGESKKRVFETSLEASPQDRPIRHAVDTLGPRMTVIWAP